jgi:hypothetical protein
VIASGNANMSFGFLNRFQMPCSNKTCSPEQGKILHFYAFLLDKPQKYVKADEQRL